MHCRGIGTHLTARELSHGFSRVAAGTWGFVSIKPGMAFKTRVCSASSRLLSSCEGHLGILLEAWQGNRDAS